MILIAHPFRKVRERMEHPAGIGGDDMPEQLLRKVLAR
jgi:hypothetical protein